MSKKMCPKKSSTPDNTGTPHPTRQSSVKAILQFDPPIYKENGAGSYIEFRSYDPEIGGMRRKTIKLNRIKGVNNRRNYARKVIKQLNLQLNLGWNPWIAKDVTELYIFQEALDRYDAHIEKMLASGYFRKETYAGYKSYLKMMKLYIKEKKHIYYVYQFDRTFCVDFLDYVFIERDNGAQTRNNYLNFLRVFSGFLVEKGYLKSKPTDGIQPISKRLYKKQRECIPLEVIGKITDYCSKKDPHFLFACYLLYYCFIRPVEMTRLKVRDFDIHAGTVTIPADCSKNKKTQTVTIPKKVLYYAASIGVFSAPMSYYIFSYGLKPGKVEIDPKHFRDHWDNLRKPLGLRKEWKFYSLKDTGITEMLRANMPAIEVRDQARHSSLAITEIYTDHKGKVNPDILNLDGAL